MNIAKTPFETILLCPGCGGEYLHHEEVDVFNRAEDSLTGQHTHIPSTSTGSVTVRSNLDGNPSVRRHGLRIEVWCELCHGRFSLCLAQHKGITYLHWERSLEPLPHGHLPGTSREWTGFEVPR